MSKYKKTNVHFNLQPGSLTVQVAGDTRHTENVQKLWDKTIVTMGLDLQPGGLTAGIAGHCQPDKKISIVSESSKFKVQKG